MPNADEHSVLEALLSSWDRNNAVMLNLLRALPEGGLGARAVRGSPSVGAQFSHIHHERLVSVLEEAPEFALPVPEQEWADEQGKGRLEGMGNAVKGRVEAGRDLDLNYGHPVLMLQLLLWHEGYHHGQIKLALKLSGRPLGDETAGPLTWDVWRARF